MAKPDDGRGCRGSVYRIMNSNKNLRLLVLASYPESCAATRFRILQYAEELERQGIQIEFDPFVDEAFFEAFYKPGHRVHKAAHLATQAARRLIHTTTRTNVDAVFIQREAAVLGPAYTEFLLSEVRDLPIVFDFDDAIWHFDGVRSRHPFLASIAKRPEKCWRTMKRATRVVAGSQYLAEQARQVTAHVDVVPTVVSADLWKPLPCRAHGEHAHAVPRLGWVGSHSTAHQLEMVAPALKRLRAEGHRFEVHVVGAAENFTIEGLPLVKRNWEIATEIDEFQSIDIGLAPMLSAPVYQGKCGFKQLQYMAVGVPMVSSWVGGAKDFVVDGENALVAHKSDDWYSHLLALLTDAALRKRLSKTGRTLVEETYSLKKQAPILGRSIVAAAGG